MNKTIYYKTSAEVGLETSPDDFKAAVASTLNDPRGWSKYGYKFVDVGDNTAPSHRVLPINLVSYDTIMKNCKGRAACGKFSYYRPAFHDITINNLNWMTGGDSSADMTVLSTTSKNGTWTLQRYRDYVINHEVGHSLGLDHQTCARSGGPGSIMMQMTRGAAYIAPCTLNEWPLDPNYFDEIKNGIRLETASSVFPLPTSPQQVLVLILLSFLILVLAAQQIQNVMTAG
jgi:hypothetical protein